ncbi:LysR substrate-binding domain-containing protein [Halomonas aquatica]|uniref:LysR substrate-binding domain-containing protein n=1 Tax=Halomonas aquatica TaxID=3151123 RepID=A0ABV1NCX1_9GAMM
MSRHLNAQTHAWMKVFAVRARHLSFTRAADELHVTTGAVSQQLEQRLGFRPFRRLPRRLPRRLELTEEGRRLAAVVDEACQAVGLEVCRLRSGVMSGVIRLRSAPSFLHKWLMPRLPRLQARFPDIELHFTTEDSSGSQRDGDFDLALNDGHTPGLSITPLMEERIFPVCAPALLRGRPACATVSSMRRAGWTTAGWPRCMTVSSRRPDAPTRQACRSSRHAGGETLNWSLPGCYD